MSLNASPRTEPGTSFEPRDIAQSDASSAMVAFFNFLRDKWAQDPSTLILVGSIGTALAVVLLLFTAIVFSDSGRRRTPMDAHTTNGVLSGASESNSNVPQFRESARLSAFAQRVISTATERELVLSPAEAIEVEKFARSTSTKYPGVSAEELAAAYLTLRIAPDDSHTHTDAILGLEALLSELSRAGGR
jgi:hypothetical protein